MRKLFYDIVTMITEYLTGLDHTNLKLWNLGTYLRVSNEVTWYLNIMIALVIVLIVVNITDVIIKIRSNKKKHFSKGES